MDNEQTSEQKRYQKTVKSQAPKRPVLANCAKAFLSGGLICAIGQLLQFFFISVGGLPKEEAAAPATAVLILFASILTATGVYDNIAQWAGAGSAVPVTGFSNGITAAALEHRSEGFILGVGCNMFKIAGPVIVYGVVAAFFAGLIQLAWQAFSV